MHILRAVEGGGHVKSSVRVGDLNQLDSKPRVEQSERNFKRKLTTIDLFDPSSDDETKLLIRICDFCCSRSSY